jgi:transcriptional regulator with XRE-family HTH domain
MLYNNHMRKDLYLLTTGARFRQRREAAQLTLADVSQRSGVTIAHLSRIENGLADPSLSTAYRVLAVMGGTLSDLAAPRIATVPVDTVLERRASGWQRIDRAGLGSSDPSARLDRKERAGIDVTVERSALESS